MDFIVVGLLFSLFAVLIQDLKFRRIHVFLPILIFILSILVFNRKGDLDAKIYLSNAVFFIIILGVLIVYMSLKNKKIINPFANYFGLGDLLFFLAVTPLFLTYNYILFFIISMIFSIVMQLLFKKIMKDNTVPLAGFSALLLSLIVIKDLLFSFNKITVL